MWLYLDILAASLALFAFTLGEGWWWLSVLILIGVLSSLSLGCVVVRFDRTAAPISSVAAESVRPIHSAPSPNTAPTSAIEPKAPAGIEPA